EMYVTPNDAMAVIPELPRIYDEPFSDSSQIPTCLVSRLARRHVTVALSGDGGDELFGGYERYQRAIRVWQSLSATPRVARVSVAKLIGLMPQAAIEAVLSGENALSRFVLSRGLTADRVAKVRDMLRMDSPRLVCRDMVTHWRDTERLVGVGDEFPTAFSEPDVQRHF